MSSEVAVVTGASGGIGRAIAKMLSECGGPDLKIGLHFNKGRAAAERLQSELPNAFLIEADLEREDAADRILEQTLKQGSPFILVNNAGLSDPHEPALMIERASFDRMMAVNFATPLFLMQKFGKEMARAESGIIVNVSSVLARHSVVGSAVYRATKAALEASTKQFAMELGPKGVRVNAVAPGFIQTAMTDAIPDETKALVLARVGGQLGQPESVASSVKHLIENDYLNGIVLQVDGGLLA